MRPTMAMAVMATLAAAGGKGAPTPARTVTICMDSVHDIQIRFAVRGAADLFSAAGIRTAWHLDGSCQSSSDAVDVVMVSFLKGAPKTERPGSLAYALPYEGTHIVVYYDRVQRLAVSDGGPKGQVSLVLEYVLVHEITHLLEGVSRHSNGGIMKAHWDSGDYFEMARKKFVLSLIDIDLVNKGLHARALVADRR